MTLHEEHLARYAVRSCEGGDRRHAEQADPLRSPFEVDRHRVIESTSFRRLEHKTQVFVAGRHDHFRTRLTHTLEVAQIARVLASALSVNESLSEVVALAHDLGHPPFGHAGEKALNDIMASSGGFNHNAHSLRVVDYLEHPFPAFRGLNLTYATRAGLATHETPYDAPDARTPHVEPASQGKEGNDPFPPEHDPGQKSRPAHRLSPDSCSFPARNNRDREAPSIEAQIASLADRIAFNCHDLEDAIGAGMIELADLESVDLWREIHEGVQDEFGDRPIYAIRRFVLDRMLDGLLSDAIRASKPGLERLGSTADVRRAASPLVVLSPEAEARLAEIERYLHDRVYRHPEVAETDRRGRTIIMELVEAYRAEPRRLPERFVLRVEEQGLDRVICDYIAGMTDRFCEREHERLVLASR